MPLTVHDERLTRRVGAAVLVAAALTVVLVVGVLDRIERDGVVVHLRFGEVLGLPAGAPVRLAGHDIGVVRRVAIARGGGAVTEIVIEPAWAARIPVNAEFFVDARSPLAPRYIAIGPPAGGAGPARALVDGDLVTGIDPPNLDRVLQRTWDNLTEVSDFLAAIQPAVQQLEAAVARLTGTIAQVEPRPGASAELARTVAAAVGAAERVIADLRAGQVDPAAVRQLVARVESVAARIEATVDELRARIAGLRDALATVRRGLGPGGGVRLDAALARADEALASARTLAGQVRAVIAATTTGRGTVAAFAADLELVDDVRELTKQLKRQPWQLAAPPPR